MDSGLGARPLTRTRLLGRAAFSVAASMAVVGCLATSEEPECLALPNDPAAALSTILERTSIGSGLPAAVSTMQACGFQCRDLDSTYQHTLSHIQHDAASGDTGSRPSVFCERWDPAVGCRGRVQWGVYFWQAAGSVRGVAVDSLEF